MPVVSAADLSGTIQNLITLHYIRNEPKEVWYLAFQSGFNKHVFSVAEPSIWNGLLLMLHSLARALYQAFLFQLKMILFGRSWVGSTSE